MSETAKRITAIGATIVALAVLVYGSYLPYRKSTLFIAAIQNVSSATSLENFLVPFMAALEARSPIGQEELIRSFSGTISNVLSNPKAANNQKLVRVLGAILDRYAEPVIERRSGLSQAQTLYSLSGTYSAVDDNDGTKNFREREIALLTRGLELSPDRPQFLYPLVDYETRYGTSAQALVYAKRIKELWPGDTHIDKVIKDLQ